MIFPVRENEKSFEFSNEKKIKSFFVKINNREMKREQFKDMNENKCKRYQYMRMLQ